MVDSTRNQLAGMEVPTLDMLAEVADMEVPAADMVVTAEFIAVGVAFMAVATSLAVPTEVQEA